MITVYFEKFNKAWSMKVATFEDEDTYLACLPALEVIAAAKGCIVTESMDADAT
jgi:hypothetical protein